MTSREGGTGWKRSGDWLRATIAPGRSWGRAAKADWGRGARSKAPLRQRRAGEGADRRRSVAIAPLEAPRCGRRARSDSILAVRLLLLIPLTPLRWGERERGCGCAFSILYHKWDDGFNQIVKGSTARRSRDGRLWGPFGKPPQKSVGFLGGGPQRRNPHSGAAGVVVAPESPFRGDFTLKAPSRKRLTARFIPT